MASGKIEEFLTEDQHKSLLRFVFVGSVDDGKSTLLGRLLHDTQGVYEDQLEAVKKASKQEQGEIDFSLFTDGLKAEREQGITIDVAYRYFATKTRIEHLFYNFSDGGRARLESAGQGVATKRAKAHEFVLGHFPFAQRHTLVIHHKPRALALHHRSLFGKV